LKCNEKLIHETQIEKERKKSEKKKLRRNEIVKMRRK
jgi:hypothetical protein